jgi:hypothetical protein
MKTKITKDELRLVILECAEYFRDEITFGVIYSERQMDNFTKFRDKCFAALGDHSMADADRLKAKVKSQQVNK